MKKLSLKLHNDKMIYFAIDFDILCVYWMKTYTLINLNGFYMPDADL